MKKILTFVLVAFLLVFTFQALPVPKNESMKTATAASPVQTCKLAEDGKTYENFSRRYADRAAAKIKPGSKNKIFENSGTVTSHESGYG